MSSHLAVFNIAKMRFPIDDPRMSEFVDNLDVINKLGDESPGFVWRHQTEDGNSTSERIFDDNEIIPNLTMWDSVEALRDYTYKTDHTPFLRRRREWFIPLEGWPVLVLWWVPEGHIVTLEEAKAKLTDLRENGPTAAAFTFRESFPPPST